jgi:hypothetical protein
MRHYYPTEKYSENATQIHQLKRQVMIRKSVISCSIEEANVKLRSHAAEK